MSSNQQIPLNDLKLGWAANSVDVRNRVLEVIESGHWVHGANHKAFELELADYLGVEHVVGLASGTDALHVALMALGCQPGSKVISVANAGGYTAIAASKLGCEIIYCDIDSVTMLIDISSLLTVLSDEISAVVVTHLYGNIAPISEIVSLCKSFNVAVIEDCAQAIGGSEGAFKVGSFGDMSAFSFYPTKNLGGIGDGGAIATKSSDLANKARKLSQYGWEEKYSIQIPGGLNSRLDEIQAAVLRIGLNLIDGLNRRRLEIVAQYKDSLNLENCNLVTSTNRGNVAHLAILSFEDQKSRDLKRAHFVSANIQTGVHYPIVDTLQVGLSKGSSNADLTKSISAASRILTIPLFPEMSQAQIERVSKVLSN
jgi:aminotransferase EvaB